MFLTPWASIFLRAMRHKKPLDLIDMHDSKVNFWVLKKHDESGMFVRFITDWLKIIRKNHVDTYYIIQRNKTAFGLIFMCTSSDNNLTND